MAAREKGGRVVFIGNIPYGVSEEQICEIFGRVGSVVNFRLVYDKETQRPKGFGFLEYTDVDAAASAVRNLNDFDIMGRTLRVDYSNDNGGGKKVGGDGQRDGGDGGAGGGRAPPPAHFNADHGPPAQVNPGALPPLPTGIPLSDGLTAPDAVSKTLATMPPAQLLDIVSQMKSLCTVNPAQASSLLQQAPQLGYAIFQALLMLGLVDTSVLSQLIQGGSAAQAAPAPQPVPQQQQAPPPMQYQQPPQMHAQPPPQQQHQQYPPQPQYAQPAPQPQYAQSAPQQQYGTPVQQPYQAPPPQVPQGPPPNPQIEAILAAMPAEQKPALRQILEMSREQIFALDETARGQIVALRGQLGFPVY